MRILFMTQVLPYPLDAGPKIRAYHVLRYLAEAGHSVHLLSFVRQGETDQHLGPLRRICASVNTVPLSRSRLRDARDGIRSVFSSTPFLILRDQFDEMRRRVEQLTLNKSFDAVHADQLWMAPYGITKETAGLRVLDQHNAVFMIPRRLAGHHRSRIARTLLRNEAAKLEAFERKTCQDFDRVVWVTEEDRKAVAPSETDSARRDAVIPIATDPRAQQPIKRDRPFRVTFLGGMHWPPNLEGISWFAEKVWPAIALAEPSAVLTLIGKGAPTKLQRDGIEVAGYVNDLEQYLSETAVFVVPLHSGAGMRVKILDAWCWGLPVVSTTVGAEGLRASSGENLLIADEEDVLADAVLRVIRDRAVARRLSDNGRATVEKYYDWKTAYKAWDQVYQ
jgi:glycosyltransferase involved in cell wall biosynthesis